MRVSELGCWALIVFAFELISMRRQVGYLTEVRRSTPNRVNPYNLDSCHDTIKLTREVSLSMALRQNRAHITSRKIDRPVRNWGYHFKKSSRALD